MTWFDLQDRLCVIMNIPRQNFRSYHEIIGGEYKDFWHVALETVVPENMANDTIVTMNFDNIEFIKVHFEFEDSSKWELKLFDAWEILGKELDPSFDGINVRFSW